MANIVQNHLSLISNRFTGSLNGTETDNTNPDQSGHGGNGKKEVTPLTPDPQNLNLGTGCSLVS